MTQGKDVDTFGENVYQQCVSSDSVSSLLATDPDMAPGDAWRKLYGHFVIDPRSSHSADDIGKAPVSKEALEKAAKCGKWGPTRPSPLFLRVRDLHQPHHSHGLFADNSQLYHDALSAVEEDPARAMVSLSLMGSCGVVPLTIISV